MPTVHLSIECCGAQSAIKHNNGYLGHANSEREARRLAEHLLASLHQDGRPAELIEEKRTKRDLPPAAPPGPGRGRDPGADSPR
jgi:hypothetical protein